VTLPLVVKAVNGDRASLANDPDLIDEALAVDLIYHQSTSSVKSVDCPSGVAATAGKTFTCKATFTNGDVNVVTLKIGNGGAMSVASVKRA